MHILAIDQSLRSTGYALLVCREHSGILSIEDNGAFKPKTTGIHRLEEIYSYIDYLVYKYTPTVLVREMHNQRVFGAAKEIQGVSSYIDHIAAEGGYIKNQTYLRIPATSWKKIILGKGNIKKNKHYIKLIDSALDKDLFINYSSNPSKKLFNVDEADAICLGLAAYKYILYNNGMVFDKETMLAVAKSAKAVYDYGIAD